MKKSQKYCQHQSCQRALHDRTDRFCRSHQLGELKRVRKAHPGYFQPLRFKTFEGPVKLSAKAFLLLEEEMEVQGESRLQLFCVDC